MITVAIVGAGIGAQHLDGYLELPERFKVKTLCELDVARAKEAIGSADIQIEESLDKVLADPEIDLVDVCLPPHLHFSVSQQALEAGKHVVCEKPMVSSLADADRLIEITQRTGKQLTPVFQYRFGKAMAQLKALRDAGLTGRAYVASSETHWSRKADYYAADWRGTWAGENGGAVLGHAIHNHDLLTSIMGPVQRVSAFCTTRVNDIETEDCAAISMEFASGALASSSVTLGAASDTSRLRITFEGLTAESGTEPYAPAEGEWSFLARNSEDQPKIDAVLASVENVKSDFTGFLDAMAGSLDDKESNAVTIEDGRKSLELITAIYRSSSSGQFITLPIAKGDPGYSSWR